MQSAPKPNTEEKRLQTLQSYKILDTLSEAEYDRITKLASIICGTPIALVSLVDADRQWFKSKVGLDAPETPRDLAFCAHAILLPEDLLVVEDMLDDTRFHDNPLVTGGQKIRFYAGAPLKVSSGDTLGTLCVIDSVPKKLTEEQKDGLRILARHVVDEIEKRRPKEIISYVKNLFHSSENIVNDVTKANIKIAPTNIVAKRLITIVLMLAVFLFDLATPLGIAAGIAYIPIIFCALWSPKPSMPFIYATIASTLTILGFFLSAYGPIVMWIVLTNRTLSITSI